MRVPSCAKKWPGWFFSMALNWAMASSLRWQRVRTWPLHQSSMLLAGSSSMASSKGGSASANSPAMRERRPGTKR